MKRILSILLTSVMLFGCLIINVSAEDIYLKLHVSAVKGSGIPAITDEASGDTADSSEYYRAYVDNEEDFKIIVDRIRKASIEKTSKDIVMLNIKYADQLTLEKFYALYGYDKLIEEYKEKYGEDLPKEDILSYKRMYGPKMFSYHKAVAERDFEVKFDYISYELSYGFGFPGAKVIVAGDKLTFADVKTLLEDDRVESVSLSTTSSGYVSYPTGGKDSSDPANISFTDVKEGAWYYEHVNNAYSMGLMEGTSETTFEPNATLTRAMLVTIIGRLEERLRGMNLDGYFDSSFQINLSDIKDGMWYSDYVIWADESGIVEGYPDGSFRPNEPITREDAVTMMFRYIQSLGTYVLTENKLSDFSDSKEVSDYAYEPLELLYRAGIINGKSSTRIAPKEFITRAEAAKLMLTAYNSVRNASRELDPSFAEISYKLDTSNLEENGTVTIETTITNNVSYFTRGSERSPYLSARLFRVYDDNSARYFSSQMIEPKATSDTLKLRIINKGSTYTAKYEVQGLTYDGAYDLRLSHRLGEVKYTDAVTID